MKSELQRIKITEACGLAGRFVLMKRGLYWRPDAHGYTSDVREAWVLTEVEADKYTYPYDEPVTKHPAPIPDYPSDLNSAITLCDVLAGEGWTCELFQGLDRTWECSFQHPSTPQTRIENRAGRHFERHYHTADTLAEAICGCFLRVKGLWTEDTATV